MERTRLGTALPKQPTEQGETSLPSSLPPDGALSQTCIRWSSRGSEGGQVWSQHDSSAIYTQILPDQPFTLSAAQCYQSTRLPGPS